MPAHVFAPARVRARLSLVLALCGLLPAAAAGAGIVPLINKSVSRSTSVSGAQTDNQVYSSGPGEFDFIGLALSQALDESHSAWADATFDMDVSLGTDCISVNSRCDAATFGPNSHNEGRGTVGLLFLVNETQEFAGYCQLFSRDLPGANHWMRLTDVAHHSYWEQDDYGMTQPIGRIAPGSYWVEGAVDYTQTSDTGDGTQLIFGLCFQPCTPVVTQQPQDVVAQPGTTVNLQLTASSAQPPAAAMAAMVTNTYQWRRNLVSISNGGHFSGVTTDHLVITNAAYADSGRYDCVVTQGSIVEPSRQADVTIHQTTAVEPSLGASDFQLAAPRPNPFFARTALQLTLARQTTVGLAIYDALGRRIRTLLAGESMAPGSYSVDWDGRDASGARVASGVYFAQLSAGDTRVLQRAILMTGER